MHDCPINEIYEVHSKPACVGGLKRVHQMKVVCLITLQHMMKLWCQLIEM